MTSACFELREQMVFYLDGELHADERERVEAHLARCSACRETVDEERRFLENIRAAGPLHETPPDLSARVASMLAGAAEPHIAPEALRRRVERLTAGGESQRPVRRRLMALAASIVLFVGLAVTWVALDARESHGPPSRFALMAVDVHQRHTHGNLPLEIATSSPQAISDWFAGKVSFGLKLPNYQESSGQDRLYDLKGARLVGYNDDYAAYVAYQMGTRPISLVVTSDSVATPSGGDEIVSKGLRFHFDVIDGLKVITWSDRGLTYALVSDLEQRGQQSCAVCHVGTKDADFLEF